MASFFRKWLNAPYFEEDEDKTRKARLLNVILIALFLIAFLYLILAPVDPVFRPRRLCIIIPFMLVIAGLWGAMRRGYVRFVGEMVVITLWLMFTMAMGLGAGFNNPSYMGYVVVVVCAGLLLGQRATIVWAVVSIFSGFIILRVSEAGLLPVNPSNVLPGMTYWVAQTVYVLTTAILLSLALHSIEEAMFRAQQELAERMRAEEALRASENRFAQIFHVSPAPMVITGEQGITEMNDAFLQMVGYTREELLGKTSDELDLWTFGDDQARALKTIEEQGFLKDFELCFRRKTGETGLGVMAITVLKQPGERARYLCHVLDFTERRHAEEALRTSEARMRMVLENLGEGICVQDQHWNYIYANPAAHHILGWPPGTLIGKNENDVLPPGGVEIVKKENVHRIAGQITSYETDVLRPNGEVRTVLATGVPRVDEQSSLVETFVAFTDITERKKLERELQDERDFVLQIINTMGQGLSVVDEEGRFVLLNPAYLEMTGYTSDELLGKRPADVTAPEDLEILAQARQARRKGLVTSYENRLRHKDGHYLSVLVTGAPRMKEGKYAGAIAVVADLTGIKQNEEALRRTAQELAERNSALQIVNEIALKLHRSRTLQEIADGAIQTLQFYSQSPMIAFYILDQPAGTLQRLAYVGFDEDSARLGQTLPLEGSFSGLTIAKKDICMTTDLAHEDSLVRAIQERLASQGLRSIVSFPLLFQQDALGVVNFVFRDVYELDDLQRETLRAIGNTIGLAIANTRHLEQIQAEAKERRRAEEAVRELNVELERRVDERTNQLEAANKELEAFAYSVSHDLRSPLRAIDGFSNILLEEEAKLGVEEKARYLHMIRQNVGRMSKLIDDLLAFSRLGRQPLRREPVDLEALSREVFMDIQQEHQGRQIVLSIGETPTCWADHSLLRQVMFNLLSNALKYSRPREVTEIEIGGHEQDGEVIYFVRDNGVGFDMQYADKLFGVFQRLHRQDEFEGTGVGLATVQRIVHRHGGRIWAEAEVEKGATFYFTL